MKAENLMIGDFVMQNGCTHPSRVAGVTPNKIRTIWADGTKHAKDAYYFEPILLTTEILEKNGMYTEMTKMYAEGDIETQHDIDFVIPFPKGGYAHVWRNPHGADFFHIEVMTVPWGRVVRTFRYVHELQQALRMCGLIEEANNFKV